MSGLKMKSKTAKELKINLKEEVEKSLDMTKAELVSLAKLYKQKLLAKRHNDLSPMIQTIWMKRRQDKKNCKRL